ncbi:MAG: AMP-binding protein [Rhodopseudomonas palustris]|nr:AMP-binding protein [Rhodopseudomonas palustris]
MICRSLDALGPAAEPSPLLDVKLFDREMREVAVGEPGEICVRGTLVMDGYWKRPEATAASAARRLAAYRRCRRLKDEARLLLYRRPHQGHDHLRRLQHLSARGRGCADGASRRRVRPR